ncbi:hypothetical protein [Rhizobium sp. BK176]|uniref:hypothetical protein n=1 Tax=Rhizobium sp. BK176 TaxID=2587071 RepID=UPI0021676109|nr:hypothetical protein [Rhizobium sp. BK176]MCS4088698.1 putative house-cleaning noncanonical NTP pyrophosphatase (MazG superfamily) [Rhizobium sp. BK176]
MTDLLPENVWRTPQLVRDRMTVRDGQHERIVTLTPDVGLALLLYKLHNELYEIEVEPSAEEIADFLTALQAVYDVVAPHWRAADPTFEQHDPASMPLPAFVISMDANALDEVGSGYGPIHGLIQAFARNLLDRSAYAAIIKELSRSAKESQIEPDLVLEQYMQKIKRHGGFDAHILRVDTRFQG